MTVRAKFRLNSYTTTMQSGGYAKKPDGSKDYSKSLPQVEMRTLNFTPVSEGPENEMFWAYTPSGSLQLGVVNQEAWKHFELNKEYYLDFTPAE